MLGKAIDFYIPDVELESVRDAGLRLQRGGVGFYPSSGAPFIHMDVGSVRHWPRVPEAQLARIMSKGPLTRVASNSPAAQKQQKARPAVVASRNTRDEDEDAEVVTRPAQRSRVTASVAPQQPPSHETIAAIVAAVPMPKSRPGAVAEPAPSGFSLASASSQPVRAPARQEPRQAQAPEAAPSGGYNLASVSSQPVIAPHASGAGREPRLRAAGRVGERHHQRPRLLAGSGRNAGAADPAGGNPRAPAPRLRKRRSPAASHAAAWRRGRCPTARRHATPSPIAPANQVVESRPGQASKARVVARLPAAQQHDTGIGTAKQATRPANASVKVGERFNNPWMRAMIVSPSALDFMSTSLFGAPDTAALRPHLAKPAATVMMTFSDDPYLGMSSEQFRGNAVVFVATVTFRQRTAALR